MRGTGPYGLVLLGLASLSCNADSAVIGPAESRVLSGPNFVAVRGLDALAPAALGCFSQRSATHALHAALESAWDHDAAPELAVVFIARYVGCDDLFYGAVSNDVLGIGYQHLTPNERFDESPESRLEGIAFLNDLPYWLDWPVEFESALLHELGHRWLARVHVDLPDRAPDALLGRQGVHWSYFLDSGGSPLEGNQFLNLTSTTYRAVSPLSEQRFSALDLYLMGLLDAAEVAEQRLMVPQGLDARDCLGFEVTAASPPQYCEPLELEARPVSFSLEDIMRVEGHRAPASRSEPRQIDVGVYLFGPEEPLPSDDCEQFTQLLERGFSRFASATGGRMTLNNITKSDQGCRTLQ